MSNLALNIAVKAQNQTNAGFAQVAAAQNRVKLAVDQAKLSYDRYVQAMNSAKATQSQMQVAADKVAVAYDRVKIAESNVTTATERAKAAQQRMVTTTKEEGSALSSLKERLGASVSSLTEFASEIGMVVMGVQSAIGLVQGLAQSAIGLAQAMIAPNAAMEQATIAMKTLIPNAQQAQQMLDALWQFAAKTPFQFPDIDAAAQKLLAFGVAARNIKPDLTAIGDALSALGRTTPAALEGVVEIFGKIQTQGRMMTRDMMMLSNWGINAWGILSKQMGVTHAQLQVMLTKGLIPASKAIEMLRRGMEQSFGGGMLKQAYTFNGLITTLKDNIALAWRNMTGPLFNVAKRALIDLGNLVSSPRFQSFARMIGSTLAPAFERIGRDIGNIIGAMGRWLNTKSGMDTIRQAALLVRNAISGIWDMMKQIWSHMPDFVAAFNAGRDSLDLTRFSADGTKGSLKGLGEVLGELVPVVGFFAGAIVGFVNTAIMALRGLAVAMNVLLLWLNLTENQHYQMIDLSAFNPISPSYGPGSASGDFGPPPKGSSGFPGSSSSGDNSGTGGIGGTGSGTGRGRHPKSQQFTASDIADILKHAREMHLKFNEHLFAMLSTSQKIKYLWNLVGQHMDKLDKLMSGTHGGLLAYLQWILTGKKGPGLILDNGASGTPGSGTGGSHTGKYSANFMIVNNITINAGTADAKQLYDLLLRRLERDLRRSGQISNNLSGGKAA